MTDSIPTEDRKINAITLPPKMWDAFVQLRETYSVLPVDDSDDASILEKEVARGVNGDILRDALVAFFATKGIAYDPKAEPPRSRVTDMMREFMRTNARHADESQVEYKKRYSAWKLQQDALKRENERVKTEAARILMQKAQDLMAMAKTPQEKADAGMQVMQLLAQLNAAPPKVQTRTRKSKNK